MPLAALVLVLGAAVCHSAWNLLVKSDARRLEIQSGALIIGAVLIHGARAPRVISRKQLGLMKRGTVLVDVSIDQGGCFETSRPTTHSDPTYEVDGIRHYCVTNMPGATPITSTYALTNATLPYLLDLANLGVRAAVTGNPGLARGVNVAGGHITYAPVAEAVGLPYTPLDEALTASGAA